MRDWAEDVRPHLAALNLSPAREAEIVEEMSQHLDQRYDELRAHGASDDEALRAVLRELSEPGSFATRMSTLRQAHAPAPVTPGSPPASLLADVWMDLRYAARALAKRPAFAAAVVLTLALGIGATTAIFSVVYGVVLKPLPFDEPERLVALYHHGPGINQDVMNQGPATYFTYLDNQRAFEGIGAWDRQEASVTGRGEPERIEALAVTAATLPLLRVQPALGRFFEAEDDAPGSPLRVVLTHGYWQRKFGGAADVVGQTLDVDGTPSEIIGVLPGAFRFPRSSPAVLLPLQPDRGEMGSLSFGFQAFARLAPGVALTQANADVSRMIPLLDPIQGFSSIRLEPHVYPLVQYASGEDVQRVLWVLLGTVGIVLLIACANVANLFLVRAEGRQQELALRAMLGARRGRIARGLFTESLVLGLGGGAVGLLFGGAGIGLLKRLAPATLPRLDEIGLDPVVLVFTLGVSLFTALLFGMIPVLKLRAANAEALRGGRAASDAPSRQRTRSVLVVAQVAMALVLLMVSGLMIRTSLALRQVEPGFVRPEDVQTFRIEVPEALVRGPVQMVRVHEEIAERLRGVPGVSSVGLSSHITMDGEDNTNPVFVENVAVPEGSVPPLRRYKSVAPDFFETMGNPLVAGRAITWDDVHEGRPVAVISEALAREYWPTPSEAIGKRVRGDNPVWHEVVGVSGDERDDGLSRPAPGIIYWPLLNRNYLRYNMAYAVRSERVGQVGFLAELREAVWAVSPSLPLANVLTLDEIQADSMAQTSFAMVMLSIAASVALLLGMVGIYGVIAYVATQRTREIGIRVALGAQIGEVRRMFLRYGLQLTAVGIVIGIAAASLLTRTMTAMLFGVRPSDPLTYVAVSGALVVVALLAADLPARRASRVDPLVAIRAEP